MDYNINKSYLRDPFFKQLKKTIKNFILVDCKLLNSDRIVLPKSPKIIFQERKLKVHTPYLNREPLSNFPINEDELFEYVDYKIFIKEINSIFQVLIFLEKDDFPRSNATDKILWQGLFSHRAVSFGNRDLSCLLDNNNLIEIYKDIIKNKEILLNEDNRLRQGQETYEQGYNEFY